MAKKKKSGIEGIVIGIGAFFLWSAAIPVNVWIGIGVVAAIWLLVRSLKNSKLSTPEPKSVSIRVTQGSSAPKTFNFDSNSPKEDSFAHVPAVSPSSSGFSIPKAPSGHGEGVWYPSGVSVNVGDIHIPGGMVYVGTSLKTQFQENDACLIDPTKSVAPKGDYTARQTDYWPSYSQISLSARRAYLNWLCSGRNDPEADIGFVFLYFYGLERRALIDGSKDVTTRAEMPLIGNEVRRLLDIYGQKSSSFQNYASGLLEWIELSNHSPTLYKEPVPELRRTWEVPGYLKLALGQAAMAGVGLLAHVALAWVRFDPNSRLRTPAKRCATEFATLFENKYQEAFPLGLKLNTVRLDVFAGFPVSKAENRSRGGSVSQVH
jgi:TerB N-terminal domain